jgi:DNA-binding PadR family transcriptional regulator
MSVRHAMLALLSEGPKYGLQLREEFEARTGEIWPLNVGQGRRDDRAGRDP